MAFFFSFSFPFLIFHFISSLLVYELWFKQILHELGSILQIFVQEKVEERQMLVVISRMKRIVEIQKILIDQVKVLETMDALDFMDFRYAPLFLSPALSI